MLEAHDLTVAYYGDIHILKNVSFSAQEGRVTAVIGPNGAGKSTLLKTLYGVLKPKAGTIRLKSRDVTQLKVHEFIRSGMAYVPQLRSIFPELTVEENLQLGTWIFKKDKPRVKEVLQRTYERFPSLAQKRNTRAGLLSGGQQKILEIGRSLLTGPSICLLDEPSATLAPRIANQIYRTIQELKADNITIVMVDQKVRQAFEIADYVYVLELGQNKIDGSKMDFEGGLKDVIRGWLD
ncbi:MAG: ABC transporter ATP-binding protein [Desulfobacterales bacterium]|jgi:branched-chain amino acid transport system ATP-binding protein